MQWIAISRNARETTHAGRHIIAERPHQSKPWKFRELDTPLSGSRSAVTLRCFGGEYETKQLTQAVMEICATTELRHAA